MKDLYQILGVSRSDSDADIKKAYRALAKKLHPDRNPDDEKVADRFKEISAAYSIIGDKDNRAKYDAGAIDEGGGARNPFAGAGAGAGAGGGFAGFEEIFRSFARGQGGPGSPDSGPTHFRTSGGPGGGGGGGEDMFADLFGGGGRGPGQGPTRGGARPKQQPVRGKDVGYTLKVSFIDAVKGTTKRLTLRSGKTLDVKIPEGVKDGQQIRLTGQGETGLPGGKTGDALIRVSIEAHPLFRREGDNIVCEIPITVDEAVLGAKVEVPTISGRVKLNVPKGTSSGARLRLKGRGIKKKHGHGDQFVTLKIVLPEGGDKSLEAAIKKWRKSNSYTVER